MMKGQHRIVLLVLALVTGNILVACRSDLTCGGAECTHATFTYLQEGDCQLKADVYSPPGGETTPVVLWIHPGGMITGGRDWIDSTQLALYIEAGYTVVAIDYHLAPEHKLETILSDVEEAYSWLIKEGPTLFSIDPERVAVVGHSAGGYLTLLIGFRVESRPKALVAFYGYGDLTGEWAVEPSSSYNQGETITRDAAERSLRKSRGTCVPTGSQLEGRFDYYVYGRQQGTWPLEISGHDPMYEAVWFDSYEPIKNVTAEYPPTMLLHGRADSDVPFAAAERMVDALETAGVPFEFITNSTWDHVFDQEEAGTPAVEAALTQVIAFLDEHVK